MHETYMKFIFWYLQIKFYWHMATLICLHVTCGCFLAIVAELSHFYRDHTVQKAIWLTPMVIGLGYSEVFGRKTSWGKAL